MFKAVNREKVKDHDPSTIEWVRENKDKLENELIFRFPKQGENIKSKKYFAVKDYERALFYNQGALIDVLSGGVYELEKPARVKGTEIVWIDTSLIDIPWGIPKKHGIHTNEGRVVGLHGDMKIKISDSRIFYENVIAGKKDWTVQDLKNWNTSLILTSLRDIFKTYNLKHILLEDREKVINRITVKVTDEFQNYGIDLETFNIIDIKVPEDIEEEVNQKMTQKSQIQNRLLELNQRKQQIQDQLLNGEISSEEYEKKKILLENIIKETQQELNQIKTQFK